jgi:NADP-dependent 3-hydroxy acid dehydrogenase YdfG
LIARVASYSVADVTQPAEVQGYIQTALERYQGIDIVLANAGSKA